jgi:hypothetical protein
VALAHAAQLVPWRGGLGWPLAALHLLTLGTLVASAMGASAQLLPVATRQPLRSVRAVAALWWLHAPGVVLLVLGMGFVQPRLMAWGAAVVLAALLWWALLLAANLRGAHGMPGVRLHGWGAVGALLLLAASAAALVALWLGAPAVGQVVEHGTLRALHLTAGLFGVMGLLVLGLSYVLLPLFALAGEPPVRRQLASGALAVCAIGLAMGALALPPQGPRQAVLGIALAAASAAWVLHLLLARHTLATGMRRDFPRALALVRLAWSAASAALLLAAVLTVPAASGSGLVAPALPAVLGLAWLASFLFGALQRMLPFLAAMHAAVPRPAPGEGPAPRRRAPTPSSFSHEGALDWHARGHFVAWALGAAAFAFESVPLMAAAAACGLVSALAFAAFVAVLLRRLKCG